MMVLPPIFSLDSSGGADLRPVEGPANEDQASRLQLPLELGQALANFIRE